MRMQNIYFTSYTLTCGNFSWNDLHVEKGFFRNPLTTYVQICKSNESVMDKHRIVGGGLLYKVLQGGGHHSDVQLLTLLCIILTERVLFLSTINLKKGPVSHTIITGPYYK